MVIPWKYFWPLIKWNIIFNKENQNDNECETKIQVCSYCTQDQKACIAISGGLNNTHKNK